MGLAPMSPYKLVDAVLDKGLPFVAMYLEKLVGKSLVIADCIGFIHYPLAENTAPVDDFYIDIPDEMVEGQHLRKNENLYYAIGRNDSRAYVMVSNLSESGTEKAVSIIAEYSLPIKIYFDNLAKIKQNTDLLINAYVKDLVIDSQLNISRIIKQSNQPLDLDKPYFIFIAEFESLNPADLRLLKSYTLEYLKRENVHIIPIETTEFMMAIIPAHFKENNLELDHDWPKIPHVLKWKEDMEKRFSYVISCAIGEAYTLRDLHKSYNEARIVLALAKLLGKRSFVQKFSDLGVFAFILSQDKETIRAYCLNSFGGLIEYDKKNGSDLLPTLRSLVDNGFNRKATSDSLFVHINTLHYRINKIEQCLGIDVSETSTRLNLFAAIKVWDTLKTLGFWNE